MKTKAVAIQSGVAIPPSRWRSNSNGQFDYVAKRMNSGDCCTVSNRKDVMNLSNSIRKRGFKAVTRKVEGGDIRVWAVKK